MYIYKRNFKTYKFLYSLYFAIYRKGFPARSLGGEAMSVKIPMSDLISKFVVEDKLYIP